MKAEEDDDGGRSGARLVFDEHGAQALAGHVRQLVLGDQGHFGSLVRRRLRDELPNGRVATSSDKDAFHGALLRLLSGGAILRNRCGRGALRPTARASAPRHGRRSSGPRVAHDVTRVADRLQVAGDDLVERRPFRAGDLDDAVAWRSERYVGDDGGNVVRCDGLEQAGRNPDLVAMRAYPRFP